MNPQADLPHISSTLTYTAKDGTRLKNLLYLPKHLANHLPAVLVFPEWWGISEHIRYSAQNLAEAGYAAMAVDLYGHALLTDETHLAAENRNALLTQPEILIERTELALNTLANLPQVDKNRIAAIGFCFGGKVALNLARRGADIKAVCSFHGNPAPDTPTACGNIKARLLIQHGGQDSMVGMESLNAFRAEMDTANASYRIDVFPDAKHGFTNPQSDANAEKNGVDLAYNEAAAKAAWQNMLDLLAETIGRTQ